MAYYKFVDLASKPITFYNEQCFWKKIVRIFLDEFVAGYIVKACETMIQPFSATDGATQTRYHMQTHTEEQF